MKEYSYLKRAMLRELCEDSRISVTTLAKKLKCSRNTVLSNMRTLEKEFGLTYTLEFNREKINLSQVHIWAIKFGKKPKKGELEKLFAHDYQVRLVAETEGDFDLLINIATDYGSHYLNWSIATTIKLLPYIPRIMPSSVLLAHTGFFQMQNDMLRRLELSALGLDELDKDILVELNNNSRRSYIEIAKRLKSDVETIRYRVRRIMRLGIITRFTTIAASPRTNYNMAFLVNYGLAPGITERYRNARDYYVSCDSRMPLFNTFQYLCLMSGSHLLFGIGCFESEEQALKAVVMEHKEIYKDDNPDIRYARITNMLKGSLPIRNIDLSKDYKNIKWGGGSD